jgi:hypothetical protein
MKDVLGYDMGPSDSSMINGASTYEKYEYTIVEGKLHFIVEFNSSAGITDKSTITSISISQ